MLVGQIREVVQPPAGKLAEVMQVWREVSQQRRVHIQRQEIAQTSVDLVEIQSGAVRRDVLGPARDGGSACKSGGIGDGSGCDVIHADRMLRFFWTFKRFVSRPD
jgi:hypothetical protein